MLNSPMPDPATPPPPPACSIAAAPTPRSLPQEVKDDVLRHLCAAGQPFESVADLCEMSARRDPGSPASPCDPLKIIACHPRAVKWLFHAADAPLPDETEIINLRTLTTEEACAELAKPLTSHPPTSQLHPTSLQSSPSHCPRFSSSFTKARQPSA